MDPADCVAGYRNGDLPNLWPLPQRISATQHSARQGCIKRTGAHTSGQHSPACPARRGWGSF